MIDPFGEWMLTAIFQLACINLVAYIAGPTVNAVGQKVSKLSNRLLRK